MVSEKALRLFEHVRGYVPDIYGNSLDVSRLRDMLCSIKYWGDDSVDADLAELEKL